MNLKSGNRYLLPVIFAAVQFLPGLLPTVVAAELNYENTFESGWGQTRRAGTPWQAGSDCAESLKLQLVPDPAGGSGRVAKFFQAGNIPCTHDLKHRTQIFLEKDDGKLHKFLPHIDYWIGWRVYLPVDFPVANYSKTGDRFIHWSMAGTIPGETQTFLRAQNGVPMIQVNRRWVNSSGKAETGKTYNVPLNLNSWHDIIIHVKREWTNTGTFELWVDGKLIGSEKNVRTATDPADDPKDPTSKFGIYWGYDSRPDDVTIYIDNFRVATGLDGYNLVDPQMNELSNSPPGTPVGVQLQIAPVN